MPGFPRPKGQTASKRKPSVSRRAILALFAAPAADRASRLDREADHALAWGQHQRAETLSRLAAELRGVGG